MAAGGHPASRPLRPRPLCSEARYLRRIRLPYGRYLRRGRTQNGRRRTRSGHFWTRSDRADRRKIVNSSGFGRIVRDVRCDVIACLRLPFLPEQESAPPRSQRDIEGHRGWRGSEGRQILGVKAPRQGSNVFLGLKAPGHERLAAKSRDGHPHPTRVPRRRRRSRPESGARPSYSRRLHSEPPQGTACDLWKDQSV
jgi:hypothetical protein